MSRLLKYKDCDILESQTCVTVLNSYLLETDEDIKGCSQYIMDNCVEFAKVRKTSNVFNEIKTHNILYKKHFKEERTKHTDLEYPQKKIMTFLYWLASRILR